MPRDTSGSKPTSSSSSSCPGNTPVVDSPFTSTSDSETATGLPSTGQPAVTSRVTRSQSLLFGMEQTRLAAESQPRDTMLTDLNTMCGSEGQTLSQPSAPRPKYGARAVARFNNIFVQPETAGSSPSVPDEQPAAKKRRTSSRKTAARTAAAPGTAAGPPAPTRAAAQSHQTVQTRQTCRPHEASDSPSRPPKRCRSSGEEQH